MSIALLTVLVLSVGIATYMLLKRLIGPVRIVGACVVMVSLAAFIVQNREAIAHQWNSFGASPFPIFSDKPALNVPNPTHDPVPYVTFQSISKEDHNFLDEILQKQNRDAQQQGESAPAQAKNIGKAGTIGSRNESVLKAELAINTAEVKRSESITRKETVKRAELVRSRQP